MKTAKLYSVNGRLHISMKDAEEYATQNNFRITNTRTVKVKNGFVYLLDVVSI